MGRFGQAALVGIDHRPEGGAKSYRTQVSEGLRRDTRLSRLFYLARSNYAHNYINWLRKRSNDPAALARAAAVEQRLLQPFHGLKRKTARAAKYHDLDYCVEKRMIDPAVVEGFRADLFNQPVYFDPYNDDYAHHGKPEDGRNALLSMDTQALFANPHFLSICATPDLIACCKEILGPAAALTWAWAWVSNPGHDTYQSQNWHRDCSEPLNFIRIFVPVTDIQDEFDGPTVLIPGTSRHREFFEVRRFSDEELLPLQIEKGAGMVMADAGDVYFVNTFAIHRGSTPMRHRGMLTLLVSLSPSHRTPALTPMPFDALPEGAKATVAANRGFFRHIVR
ncbi:hypothetical protein BH10PSE13_BH10PSE13_02000 [soil metagenome]